MSDKLEIQNLGKESKREIVGEECMPQPPFRLCLVGSSSFSKLLVLEKTAQLFLYLELVALIFFFQSDHFEL